MNTTDLIWVSGEPTDDESNNCRHCHQNISYVPMNDRRVWLHDNTLYSHCQPDVPRRLGLVLNHLLSEGFGMELVLDRNGRWCLVGYTYDGRTVVVTVDTVSRFGPFEWFKEDRQHEMWVDVTGDDQGIYTGEVIESVREMYR